MQGVRRWEPAVRAPALLLISLSVFGQDTTFRTTVPVVIAPASVSDAQGHSVDGLGPDDFTVLDEGSPQRFQLETSDTVTTPLSVVIAVQANSTAPAAILRIRKIGSMIEPLITGARGSAALLSFGSEIRLVQDFTNDPDKLTSAFRAIRTQPGRAAVTIDALAEAVRMLAEQPVNARRVVFIISESKDRGSKTKLQDAVKAVQSNGVSVYPVVFSSYVSPFATKASELPPPESGLDLIAAIGELARLGKADTAQTLAGYSGGRKSSFTTLHGLEQVVTSLGEELHSQYIFSYTNPVCAPGLHRIEIRVKSHPGAVVRARYGYWTDADACRGADSKAR